MDKLLLKVCGMRDPENIAGLVKLSPDLMGFIFYPGSRRYVRKMENAEVIRSVPFSVATVGVFVNEPLEQLLEAVVEYNLDYVQLHGGENPGYCRVLAEKGIKVIKVFSVEDRSDLAGLKDFEDHVVYFLFDTKTAAYGGSGKTFDWSILQDYDLKTPYFLSGGIGLEELETIDRSRFPGLVGLDVNSRFESEPGLKNLVEVEKLMNSIS